MSLVRALAISIAFHVLLLWPATVAWQEAVPSAPMVASLRPAAAPVAPARQTAVQQRTPPPPAKARAIVAEQAETRLPATSVSTAGPATGSEPQTEPPAAEARPAVASALPASPGPDAEGLRSYRVALAGEARRYKRYPARAVEAGWSGTTELRISVTPGQSAAVVQMTRSSGFPVLDEAALEMVRRAVPATPIPASLRERAFSVDLPIVFDLPQ